MTKARNTWPRCSANSPQAGLVNIVGGCCGTTPDAYPRHRRRGRAAWRRANSRSMPRLLRLSGSSLYAHAGDPVRQCRRAHQRHRLGQVPQADHGRRLRGGARVARQQVENGAQIIDVNMDEGLLDSRAGHGDVPQSDRRPSPTSRASGDGRLVEMAVIEAGLKCVQGKPSSTRSR